MSLILDALHRGRSKSEEQTAEPRPAQTDAVLATLGYSPWRRDRRSARFRKTAGYALVALVCALAVWGVAIWYTRPNVPAPLAHQTYARVPGTREGSATLPLAPPAPAERPQPVVSQAPPGTGSARTAQPAGGPAAAPPAPAPVPVVQRPVAAPAAPVAPASVAPKPLASPARASRSPETASGARRQSRVEPIRPSTPASRAPLVTAPQPGTPSAAPARGAVTLAAEGTAGGVISDAEHFKLGVYYHRAGDFENALVHYKALLERNELNAEVHNNLGLLYQNKGLMDEAVKEFQRAIFIDQRYVKAHNNLGVAFLHLGKVDAAAGEFRAALASDPRNVESLVNLALAMKAGGQREEARETLVRALTVDPRNAASHYNLAMLCEESGELSMALEHYRAFVQYGSAEHTDLIPEVRAKIDALSGHLVK